MAGDEALISIELTRLVEELVGDADRDLVVDEIDCADSQTDLSRLMDALTTMSLFMDRRVVIVRNLHEVKAADVDTVVTALDATIDGIDIVATTVGRLPKSIDDVFKAMKAHRVGATVVSKQADRIKWVETRFVEAGFTYTPEVPRIVEAWFGGDHSRMAGLLQTLLSTYGDGAKLTRTDVEVFLGDAGRIEPWKLTDPIDSGDTSTALVMLHRMLSDSHPFQVLGLLANRYAQMMKIDGRGVRTAQDAAGILGGHEFAAKKVLETYLRLGSAQVARAVSLIAEADLDLRGGKDWEPEMVLEVLVARLSRLGGAAAKRSRPTQQVSRQR